MPAAERKDETSPRAYWLRVLNRIARPVLVAPRPANSGTACPATSWMARNSACVMPT